MDWGCAQKAKLQWPRIFCLGPQVSLIRASWPGTTLSEVDLKLVDHDQASQVPTQYDVKTEAKSCDAPRQDTVYKNGAVFRGASCKRNGQLEDRK